MRHFPGASLPSTGHCACDREVPILEVYLQKHSNEPVSPVLHVLSHSLPFSQTTFKNSSSCSQETQQNYRYLHLTFSCLKILTILNYATAAINLYILTTAVQPGLVPSRGSERREFGPGHQIVRALGTYQCSCQIAGSVVDTKRGGRSFLSRWYFLYGGSIWGSWRVRASTLVPSFHSYILIYSDGKCCAFHLFGVVQVFNERKREEGNKTCTWFSDLEHRNIAK